MKNVLLANNKEISQKLILQLWRISLKNSQQASRQVDSRVTKDKFNVLLEILKSLYIDPIGCRSEVMVIKIRKQLIHGS